MAIIIPYGDSQAHGSLGDSVSFRRRFGRVVFQKKPHPRQPNSPGQQAQKQKFKEAWTSYHGLTAWQLEFYRDWAKSLGTTGANLYLSLYLKNELPDPTRFHEIKNLTDLDLITPIMPDPNEVQFRFYAQDIDRDPSWNLGHTWDNSNIFTAGLEASAHQSTKLLIWDTIGGTKSIPAGYEMIMWFDDFSDAPKTGKIKLPAIDFPSWPPLNPIQMTRIKRITDAELTYGFSGSGEVWIDIQWSPNESWAENSRFGRINWPANTWTGLSIDPAYTKIRIRILEWEGSSLVIAPGAYITLNWINHNDEPHVDYIAMSPATLPVFGEKHYYIANDWSAWDDINLTIFEWAPYQETEKFLWLASDLSTWYDDDLFQIASIP